MEMIYVKFLNQQARVQGFFEIAKQSRIRSLPGEIYQISVDALKILDDLHIDYRRATDTEVKNAHDQVRNPCRAVL